MSTVNTGAYNLFIWILIHEYLGQDILETCNPYKKTLIHAIHSSTQFLLYLLNTVIGVY